MGVREVSKSASACGGRGFLFTFLPVLAAIVLAYYVASHEEKPDLPLPPQPPAADVSESSAPPHAPSYHALMAAAAAAASGPRMPWEEEGGEFSVEQIDEFGHMFRVHDFLTSAEVAHVRSLASDRGRYKEAMPGTDIISPNINLQFSLHGDAVVGNVSERIGRLTDRKSVV